MDILVSQLNQRLALQLPTELPLGLVFVTGTVRSLIQEGEGQGGNGERRGSHEAASGRTTHTTFDLEQAGHRLRCKLSQREAERTVLYEAAEVRLGGHLAFDPRRAEYYLLARDVEVTGGPAVDPLALDLGELVEDEAAFTAALAGIKRRSDVARQSSSSLPDWVQKIAPPELQETDKAETEVRSAAVSRTSSADLDPELVDFLSSAMEGEEDVELTHDMLAHWAHEPEPEIPAIETAVPLETTATDEAEFVTAVQPYAPVADPLVVPEPSPPIPTRTRTEPHHADWVVVVLMVTMVVFTCAILLTAVLLALR
jgi:hypothetical protein